MSKVEEIDLQRLLSFGNAEQIYASFSEGFVQGNALSEALKWLEVNRLDVRNRVLCLYFGVACYHVGTSCFADKAASDDKEKWFVSVDAPSDLDSPEFVTKLNPSQAEAESHAVEVFGLLERFNTRHLSEMSV